MVGGGKSLSIFARVWEAGFGCEQDPLRITKSRAKYPLIGSLAQLVERFVYTEDVGSSSLSRPTIFQVIMPPQKNGDIWSSRCNQPSPETASAKRAGSTTRKPVMKSIAVPKPLNILHFLLYVTCCKK